MNPLHSEVKPNTYKMAHRQRIWLATLQDLYTKWINEHYSYGTILALQVKAKWTLEKAQEHNEHAQLESAVHALLFNIVKTLIKNKDAAKYYINPQELLQTLGSPLGTQSKTSFEDRKLVAAILLSLNLTKIVNVRLVASVQEHVEILSRWPFSYTEESYKQDLAKHLLGELWSDFHQDAFTDVYYQNYTVLETINSPYFCDDAVKAAEIHTATLPDNMVCP